MQCVVENAHNPINSNNIFYASVDELYNILYNLVFNSVVKTVFVCVNNVNELDNAIYNSNGSHVAIYVCVNVFFFLY